MTTSRLPDCYGDEDCFLSDETGDLEDYECTRCPWFEDCQSEVDNHANERREKLAKKDPAPERHSLFFGSRAKSDLPPAPAVKPTPRPTARSFQSFRERRHRPAPPPPPLQHQRARAEREVPQPALEVRQTRDGTVSSVAFINGVMRRHEETRVTTLTPNKAERFVRRAVTGGLRGLFFEAFEFFCDEEL